VLCSALLSYKALWRTRVMGTNTVGQGTCAWQTGVTWTCLVYCIV